MLHIGHNNSGEVARTTDGLSPSCTWQLYNTVAVPAFTYASDIWYIPPIKWPHSQISCGSVSDTKSLQSTQGTAARYIIGGIHGTAYDMLEAHADLPPANLLFCKVQFRAASRICTLLSRHPLHPIAHCTAARFIWSHRSPLYYLFLTTGLNPKSTETLDPVCQHPNYRSSLKTTIEPNKDLALTKANGIHIRMHYKVYCDGSGFEGDAGTSAVLYKDNCIMKSLCYYLGPLTEHMIYELELVGLLLALHLLPQLTCHLLPSVIIGLDNQVAICSLTNQDSKPAHYLLDAIHDATERLHWCQDWLQYKDPFRWDWQWNQQHITKSNGIVDLQIHWIPGHLDFVPNDKANKLTKEAATENSSPPKDLPALLRKPLPTSLSALHQESKAKIQHWKTSSRYRHMGRIDKSILSKKWMKLMKSLSHKQASIVMQLHTGHIGLNKCLH